jgi:hypothetical protein
VSSLDSILIAYVFLGCVYWLWMLVGAWRITRAVPVLAGVQPPDPQPWPRLSVVIPACNEADTLEAAAHTILSQDYPDLEIILIDDRSSDGTGAVIDRIAAGDTRVRPLHIADLPEGWLGKVHALWCGSKQAHGDWLLFTDADVHLAPGMLRRAVAYAEACGLGHLAAAPDLLTTRFILDAAISQFLRTFCVGMRCWAVGNPKSRAYVGVGAFNLVRRAALAQTEGFPWLRLEVADDLALGMMLKRAGARSCLVNASGLLDVHWYRSVAEMARGTEKAFASVARCSVLRLLVVCVALLALEWAPLAALLPIGPWGLLPAGLAMLAAAVTSVVILHRWTHRPILPGLCFPLAALFGVGLLLRAGWLGLRRGGALWRGTLYPSKLLRKGSRVRFP